MGLTPPPKTYRFNKFNKIMDKELNSIISDYKMREMIPVKLLWKYEDPRFPQLWTYFRYTNGDKFFCKYNDNGQANYIKYVKSGNPLAAILPNGKLYVSDYDKMPSWEWSQETNVLRKLDTSS